VFERRKESDSKRKKKRKREEEWKKDMRGMNEVKEKKVQGRMSRC
jgi:hypothetical protein